MAKLVDLSSMSDEDALKYLIEVLRMPEDQARFLLALQNGDIEGDLIEVDDERTDD